MPVICAATGCNNKFIKGSEIRFYRFPLSKPQLASKWVHSLGMKNFIPTANTCLCSEHFKTDCFRDYNGKQFLREDAVPTIFTPSQDSSKIELRKRGVVPKETPAVTQMATPADKERAREAVMRREKQGGMRDKMPPKKKTLKEKREEDRIRKRAQRAQETPEQREQRLLKMREYQSQGRRGGRGAKQMSDRQSMGLKSRVYDSKGRLLSNGKDMCDCLDVDCMGCFYPCPDCGSRKCGVECRCDRKWLYEQVEVEGGEIIRNKFAV
ncbi:ARL14 effector protein isoform X1 [Acanthochromis polyacanthus]|uniref:ARL14 effector protein isoform X1 n=1 Tax=Acanthochromis polyacanthus TaxID=80966 RepID=UPI00223414C3|nr:ARL14 effector protein isoform X1 [Acanthochromis polyacanthus]